MQKLNDEETKNIDGGLNIKGQKIDLKSFFKSKKSSKKVSNSLSIEKKCQFCGKTVEVGKPHACAAKASKSIE